MLISFGTLFRPDLELRLRHGARKLSGGGAGWRRLHGGEIEGHCIEAFWCRVIHWLVLISESSSFRRRIATATPPVPRDR